MSEHLSILCVTKNEKHALSFVADMGLLAAELAADFVLVADGKNAYHGLMECGFEPFLVHSRGFIESVLDDAVKLCRPGYVLRLDDDERCSKAMVEWLEQRAYEEWPHWRFARAHLWGDERHMLATPELWHDCQTRLSLRELSDGRTLIHAGSPHGGGKDAPCAIEHHKFLVKSLHERRQLIAHYDAVEPYAGSKFCAFSCPEDFYRPDVIIGAVRTWDGDQLQLVAA
jgi:hypothetical protein